MAHLDWRTTLMLQPDKAKKLAPIINELIAKLKILPFTEKTALKAAEIRSILKKSGSPIGSFDLLIASTAIEHNLTLVTSNLREFERINGLLIQNWR